MHQTINKVVIVGGGTAGWLTAGVLAARYQAGEHGVEVVLIESPDVATIGVGEGTWPSMRATLQSIGVSETAFIRECDASFKQGSCFQGWRNGGVDRYYHPFSLPQGYSELNLAPFWQPQAEQISFADAVSQQSRLCELGRAPKQISTPEFAFIQNYGYHLDAGKFAEFLTRHCVSKLGVTHIRDHVVDVIPDQSGYIQEIKTQQHGELRGDIFVDCTGFSSVLIGQHYQVPMQSIQPYLFNDRALAVQLPYPDPNAPIASATLATAHSGGWIWDIGLPSRRGVGAVYASDFMHDTEAEAALMTYLTQQVGAEAAQQLTPRTIKFNPGYRNRFWHKNCVAIGLSAGFVEPLEASALVMVEFAAKMLAEQLPANRETMTITAKQFNDKFHYRWQRIVEFLKLHYVLSQRDDSEYWLAHRQTETIPDSLQASLNLWRYQPPWHLDTPYIDELFPAASYQYILYGMGFVTETETRLIRQRDAMQTTAHRLFNENARRTQQFASGLPDNRSLIKHLTQTYCATQ